VKNCEVGIKRECLDDLLVSEVFTAIEELFLIK